MNIAERILALFLLACLLLPTAPAPAQQSAAAPPSCAELSEIGSALDYVAEAMGKGGTVEEGSDADLALRRLVGGLQALSRAEDDREFRDAVSALGQAWQAMDTDRFLSALDAVRGNLERLSVRNCR